MRILLIAAVAVCAAPTFAQSVITGESQGNIPGISSHSRTAPRVMQDFYDDQFFAGITSPVEILSMSFRLPDNAGDNYPALGDISFANYEVTLAEPSVATEAAQGLASTTFADNWTNPVLVRSGQLDIPQGSFISNAANDPGEYSFVIDFDTPYTYTPGNDLVLMIRHDGYTGPGGEETRWNFDSYSWTGGNITATTGFGATDANFSFDVSTRMLFNYIPEPASLVLLALGGLVIRRR